LLNNKETKQRRLKSLPKILRRVAYPVEPLGFKFVQNDLPPSLACGIRDSLGKQAGLFDQLEDGQANEFHCVHGMVSSSSTVITAPPFSEGGRCGFSTARK
jgi:hypothetical protein